MTTASKTKPKGPVHRLGRVEGNFRAMADQISLTPKVLLEKLVLEGVTQKKLSELLVCTRQAVGVLAERYGVEFPGAKLDLDTQVREKTGCRTFATFYKKVGAERTQSQMADELGVSLSTVKRRIYEITGKQQD